MLLLRVFLLVMLIGDSWSVVEQKAQDCTQRECFVPELCKGTADSTIVSPIGEGNTVIPECDAILKIRSYSPTYYLIVLASYDSRATWITLEQGLTKFECKVVQNSASVNAQDENGVLETEVIGDKNQPKPLYCEFSVKTKRDELFDSATELKLTSSRSGGVLFILDVTVFKFYTKTTCDPDSVKPAKLGAVGDKTVSKVDVQLADLICPIGQKLTFRKDSASNFEEASSITCVKKASGYEFEPRLTEAQCELTTCTQCDSAMAPSIPNLETYTDGGCTKLRCKNNDRLKIGSSDPVEGSAECKFENNQHVWKFKGETIKADSTVVCQEKKKCFSTIEDVEKMCDNCKLGPDNMPMCDDDSVSLRYQTNKMSVLCDDVTGNYFYNDGNSNYTRFKDKLHCGGEKATDDAAAKQDGSKDKTALISIVAAIVCIVVIIGLVVGVWLYTKKKAKKDAKKRPEFTAPGGGASRSGQSKSGPAAESRDPNFSAQPKMNQDDKKGRDSKSAKPVEKDRFGPGNGSGAKSVKPPGKNAAPPKKKQMTEDVQMKEDDPNIDDGIETKFLADTAASAQEKPEDNYACGEEPAEPGEIDKSAHAGPLDPKVPIPKGGRIPRNQMTPKKSATPK